MGRDGARNSAFLAAVVTTIRALRRSRTIATIFFALMGACQGGPDGRSKWPPPDFDLEIQYEVHESEGRQVRKRAHIFADGLVVYREADESLRSDDGFLALPVFRRMCAYRMDWPSLRHLSRALHEIPVREIQQPANPPSEDDKYHLISFHLVYFGNRKDIVLRDNAVGLMNFVLRTVNRYLPEGHGFRLPQMVGEPLEHRLQDVPLVTDSVAGALRYHEEWLAADPENLFILRDTFALACAAAEVAKANELLSRLAEQNVRDIDALRQIVGGINPR